VSTRTNISIHDAQVVRWSICIVWDLSVSHNELELITRVPHEAIVSIFAPLERLDDWASVGEARMVVVKWIEFAGIWHFYKANCCHELTCCLLRERKGRA